MKGATTQTKGFMVYVQGRKHHRPLRRRHCINTPEQFDKAVLENYNPWL